MTPGPMARRVSTFGYHLKLRGTRNGSDSETQRVPPHIHTWCPLAGGFVKVGLVPGFAEISPDRGAIRAGAFG